MAFFSWVRDHLSTRSKILAVYRNGLARAKCHDHTAAIAEYTQVIENPDAPEELVANAMYNRALSYSAIGEDEKSLLELNKVSQMPAVPGPLRQEARRRLLRLQRRSEQADQSGKESQNEV